MCHAEASCEPTGLRGEYACACGAGYTGDGRLCSDVDECARGEHDCGPGASCVDIDGSFLCACAPGYLPTADEKDCTSGWVAAARGDQHTCGIRVDGSLWCWGDNAFGQLGIGTQRARAEPARAGDPAQSWSAVAAGAGHTCAVDGDGALWCWGDNTHGQLGQSDPAYTAWPVPVLDGRVWQSVAAGAAHTCAVTTDHSLWCWGDNGFGQLGAGDSAGAPRPVETQPWERVACGAHHTCALAFDNSLWCWGRNHEGQLGVGHTEPVTEPARVDEQRWASVSLGDAHTCAVRFAGTLWCWGDNGSGQLASDLAGTAAPEQVGGQVDWEWVAAGHEHNCAVQGNGRLSCWGNNESGQAGTGVAEPVTGLGPVDTETDWATPVAGGDASCGLKDNGTLWCWGARDSGQLGDGLGAAEPTPISTLLSPPGSWRALALGDSHACAVSELEDIWCWGDNESGQVGHEVSTVSARHLAAKVGTTAYFASLDLGGRHSCALDTDNRLWCWGDNTSGQVGVTFSEREEAPVEIEPGLAWRSVSAGGRHTCGLKPVPLGGSSELWCWGDNASGQLGDPALGEAQDQPARIGALNTWTAVSSGEAHACALRSGAPWCWGDNSFGQLGLDSVPDAAAEPERVGGDDDWTALAAGSTFTCGLRQPGSLWCWGTLGTWQSATPARVGTVETWVGITAGGSTARGQAHACAWQPDGSGWCWGENDAGQLGDGTRLERAVPAPLAVPFGWQHVSAGGAGTCGLRGGALLCWGADERGQRGDGTSWVAAAVLEP